MLPAEGEPPPLSECVTSAVVPLDPESLVRLIGTTLRRLHDAQIPDNVADASLSVRRAFIEAEALRPASQGPYVGRDGTELLAIFDQRLADLGEAPERSVVHGALTLGRCWVAPSGELFFTDWAHSGTGDRHLDIAAAASAAAQHFGPAVVAPLIDAYGPDDVDLARLDMCQLLNHLLDAAATTQTQGVER